MRGYRKDLDNNVYSSQYRPYWKGHTIGYCHQPIKIGVLTAYPKQETPMIPHSEYNKCSYGRASPLPWLVYQESDGVSRLYKGA